MAQGPHAVRSAQGWVSPLATEASGERPGAAVAGRMGGGQEGSWEESSAH